MPRAGSHSNQVFPQQPHFYHRCPILPGHQARDTGSPLTITVLYPISYPVLFSFLNTSWIYAFLSILFCSHIVHGLSPQNLHLGLLWHKNSFFYHLSSCLLPHTGTQRALYRAATSNLNYPACLSKNCYLVSTYLNPIFHCFGKYLCSHNILLIPLLKPFLHYIVYTSLFPVSQDSRAYLSLWRNQHRTQYPVGI